MINTSGTYTGFHATRLKISPANGPAIHAPNMPMVLPGSNVRKNGLIEYNGVKRITLIFG